MSSKKKRKVTNCVECGKEIEYKTKKPKWCKECKKKRPKYYRRRSIPTKSKAEATTQKLLNYILPEAEYIDNGYYSWLMSPKNAPLQLDRYYPKLKLAIEVDGEQHVKYNPFFHQTKKDFEYLQDCDQIKIDTCRKLGIDLIIIPHCAKINKAYLVRTLQQAGVLKRLKRETKVND